MAPHLLIIIIMRHSSLSLLLLAFVLHPAMASEERSTDPGSTSSRAVIRELNLARQNPALYATFVEELRGRMNGNVMVLPGHTRIGPGKAREPWMRRFAFCEPLNRKRPWRSPPACAAQPRTIAPIKHLEDLATRDGIRAMLTPASRGMGHSAVAGAKISPTANQPPAT